MEHHDKACESIDASVFSSDMLFDAERRALLKDYLGRWTRAIREHEGTTPAAWQSTQDMCDLYIHKPPSDQIETRPLWA